LVNGVRTVINNTIAHPRTSVGIDADGRKLLILVVDGRSAYSRGYTMVELADIMTALGAENAINLDGGGSSAMYSRNGTGAMSIVNEPSDGSERTVANAFGVVYHAELPPVVPILPTPPPTPTPTPTPTVPPEPTTPPPTTPVP
jgi:exopolysaccharide biosynthesis protein